MFSQRVHKLLILRGLCFALVQKSVARVRKLLKTLGRKFAGVYRRMLQSADGAFRFRNPVRVTVLWRPMLQSTAASLEVLETREIRTLDATNDAATNDTTSPCWFDSGVGVRGCQLWADYACGSGGSSAGY
jgi:hypothetical protein